MGMMDLYTKEQAVEAIEDSLATKKAFMKEIEKLDVMVFILKYYLATGEALDPDVFDMGPLEEDSDD